MSNETLIILLMILGFGLLGYLIRKWILESQEKQKPSQELLEYLKTTNQRLSDQNKDFNTRLDNAARVIAQVQKNIGEFTEIGRGMQELQKFLQSPKIRGNIGEQVLKDLLSQMLPRQTFALQYTFKSGDKVDAVIKTSAGLISIDSKFPMENFRKMLSTDDPEEKRLAQKEFEKDVKNHIDTIAKKYILPAEGTLDYALMYVTSEAIYYEVVNNPVLYDYAGMRRVLPISPTTFYAFLKAILMSFEGQKIEAQARQILSALRAIQKDYSRVEDNLTVLQKHVNNAYNMMIQVFSSFTNLGQKITLTQSLQDGKDHKLKDSEDLRL